VRIVCLPWTGLAIAMMWYAVARVQVLVDCQPFAGEVVTFPPLHLKLHIEYSRQLKRKQAP
jgi:hypothetical protein